MDRLTFEGLFCDIAQCEETPGGSFCEDGMCSQRKVWERLKVYEDTELTPEQCKELEEKSKKERRGHSDVRAKMEEGQDAENHD